MNPDIEWIGGNCVQLLENGEAYFPAVFEQIDAARLDVQIETFILFDDAVGRDLQQRLIRAAGRGVGVDLTVDGFGSRDLSEEFIAALTDAGVRLHVYDPVPFIRQLKPRRLHRKIVVVDAQVAFIGGINFSEDHLESFGERAKQDYAVRLEGPMVERIHRFVCDALAPVQQRLPIDRRSMRQDGSTATRRPSERGPLPGIVEVAFVSRDNHDNRTDIERAYQMAIRHARRSVLIANAYFFPSYSFLRDLRRAAARGVAVQLILQKSPDIWLSKVGSRLLYESLLKDGVAIYEYCRREMHGKVAVIDDLWSTVGSANLDPVALSLSLEANVLIRDAQFVAMLRQRLQHLIENDCEQLDCNALPRLTMWRYLTGALAYHVARRFPQWLRLPDNGSRIRSFVRGHRIDTQAAFDASARRDGS